MNIIIKTINCAQNKMLLKEEIDVIKKKKKK